MANTNTRSDITSFLNQSHQLRKEKDGLEVEISKLKEELKRKQNDLKTVTDRIAAHDAQFAYSSTAPPPTAPIQCADTDATTDDDARKSRHSRHIKKRKSETDDIDYAPPPKRAARRTSGFETLSANYTNIIKLDGQWTEIWCQFCAANSPINGDVFFNGAEGLRRHINRTHVSPFSTELALEYCGKRVLSEQEVEEILDGLRTVKKRVAGDTPNPNEAKEDAELGATESAEHSSHVRNEEGAQAGMAPQDASETVLVKEERADSPVAA